MPGPRVIGMTMRDNGSIDRPDRVDVKITGRTVEPLGSRYQQFMRFHGLLDVGAWRSRKRSPLKLQKLFGEFSIAH
jgi:hypothetical protein